VSVLPATAPVLSGIDTVLLAMTSDAVGQNVAVTAGPLDRPVNGTRLNWFLYRITPAPALMNMESPQTGWQTRRGRPPLALTLHYLLSADPGELSEDGNEIAVAHDALTSTMMVLHEHAILGADTVITSSPGRTISQLTSALDGLVEPVRITMDPVPLETITALWSSGVKSLRVSVAYQVSLVTVPSPVPFTPGPPVQERIVAVSPSTGPKITAAQPELASFGTPVDVTVTGLGSTIDVTLSRLDGDPDDPADGRPDPGSTHSTGPWRLAAAPARGGLSVSLPNPLLVPGRRVLSVTNVVDGLPAATGSTALTIAPAVVSAGSALVPGDPVTLQVAHVLSEGTVAFLGLTARYTRLTPTSVSVTVPAGVAAYAGGEVGVSIQSGNVTGPPAGLVVAP
jgi:hypothetical protein